MTDDDLQQIVSRAKRHGWYRDKWEAELDSGADPRKLALLASRLGELKPRPKKGGKFELRPKERRWLATRLIKAGYADDETARELIGMSRTTWWRVRRELEEGDSEAAHVSNRAEVALAQIPPPRGWSASSGTDDGWREL